VKAVLSGSIAAVGTQYAMTFEAANCENGNLLASEIAQAPTKEDVIATVGASARSLRSKLGESLATLTQYDVAIVQATTSSLDALKAYTTGFRLVQANQQQSAIAHLQRAVEVDPQFALAWAQLAAVHTNLRNLPEMRRASQQAYALRDRVTERERFYIDSRYQQSVLGDIEASIRVYEQWAQVYPRDFVPRNNLGVLWTFLGDFDKATAYYEEARRADPSPTLALSNLAFVALASGRPADAVRAATQAIAATGTNSTARATLLVIACTGRDDAR
jgi:Flp pilus assembly protein TadD